MSKVTLNLSKLNHREFSRLISSLLRDWQASKVTVEDAVLTKLKNRLTQDLETFDSGLSQIKDTKLTKTIEENDKLRENDLQLLYEQVKLARLARSKEDREAYDSLKPLFDRAAKAKRSGYEEGTAYIKHLLNQLQSADYQPHVQRLNLTKAVTELTKSQEAFETLLLKRHNKASSQVVYDNKKTRQELEESYKKLAYYLYVMSAETGTVAYTKLYKMFKANNDAFKVLTTNTRGKAKTEATADKIDDKPQAPQPNPADVG